MMANGPEQAVEFKPVQARNRLLFILMPVRVIE